MSKSDPKIHIRLLEDVHAKLRVMCAFERETIQDFVARLIEKAVKDIALPAARRTNKTQKSDDDPS